MIRFIFLCSLNYYANLRWIIYKFLFSNNNFFELFTELYGARPPVVVSAKINPILLNRWSFCLNRIIKGSKGLTDALISGQTYIEALRKMKKKYKAQTSTTTTLRWFEETSLAPRLPLTKLSLMLRPPMTSLGTKPLDEDVTKSAAVDIPKPPQKEEE